MHIRDFLLGKTEKNACFWGESGCFCENTQKDSVDFWTPFYEKSKALSIKRRIEREQQKKTSKKKGKKKFTDGFAGEEKFSRKRKKALEKARAWRASMDLDI